MTAMQYAHVRHEKFDTVAGRFDRFHFTLTATPADQLGTPREREFQQPLRVTVAIERSLRACAPWRAMDDDAVGKQCFAFLQETLQMGQTIANDSEIELTTSLEGGRFMEHPYTADNIHIDRPFVASPPTRPSDDGPHELLRRFASQTTNALTGLLVQENLEPSLSAFLQRAALFKTPCSVVMLDIDRFKIINDTLGHPIGNQVIAAVAACVLACTGHKGLAYRYGGDEFTLVLPNHNLEEALALAERIRLQVESQRIANTRISLSLGVAAFPEHASDTASLIEAADKALLDAKAKGRNIVRFFREPSPVVPGRQAQRKAPADDSITDRERDAIRREFFSTGEARCPRDRTVLTVNEATTVGSTIARLLIWCRFCGLTSEA